MSIKILIADDHPMTRDGIRSAFDKQDNIEIVGEADSGEKAVALAMQHKPDVIFMDILMPRLNGVNATRKIIASHNNIKIIALSVDASCGMVRGMFAVGAVGYLLKNSAADEIVASVRAVLAGKKYLSRTITAILADEYAASSGITDIDALFSFTEKERQVLKCIAEGSLPKQIASQLDMSERTLEKHRYSLMKKTKSNNIAALTKFAIRCGLSTP